MSRSRTPQELLALMAKDPALMATLSKIESLDISNWTVSQSPPQPVVTYSTSALRAALVHTFSPAELQVQPQELESLLSNASRFTSEGLALLRLEDQIRAEILQHYKGSSELESMLKADETSDQTLLASGTERMELLTGAWLRQYLRGAPVDLERRSLCQLSAAFAARSALSQVSDLVAAVPTLEEVKRHRDFAELIEPLRLMIGASEPGSPEFTDRFAGRIEELKILRMFVDELDAQSASESIYRGISRFGRTVTSSMGIAEARLMMIFARGGLGKSTLICKFAYQHAVLERAMPFAYLDFDNVALQARSPLQLLIETLRQVALFYPEYTTQFHLIRDAVRAQLLTDDEQQRTLLFDQFRSLVQSILANNRARAFLLVLDTVERVQSDQLSVDGVLTFLKQLCGKAFPELAIVVSGRAEFDELLAKDLPWTVDSMELDSLSQADATAMLERLGRSLLQSEWNSAWSAKLAGKREEVARREPLSLRVAVEIVRAQPSAERAQVVEQIAKLGEAGNDDFVGRLYQKRVLEHISDPCARQLAWPGLVARTITEEVAVKVLAPLCGLSEIEASQAFERLGREVWIVTREGDTLRHRPDLRSRTLPLMRRHDPQRFSTICNAMRFYYEACSNGNEQNAAQAIYYRLLHDEEGATDFVDAAWTSALAQLLSAVLEDFSPRSAVRYFLQVRFAQRLLSPNAFRALPAPWAWSHMEQTGRALRLLSDSRVDSRVLTLLEAPPQRIEFAAHQALLIKAGQWASLAHTTFVEPERTVDCIAAAYLGTFCCTANEGLLAQWFEGFQRQLHAFEKRPEHLDWQVLAYSLLPALRCNIQVYMRIDQLLAAALWRAVPLRRSFLPALRTVIAFGGQATGVALKLLAQAMGRSQQLSRGFSTAELGVLLESDGLRRYGGFTTFQRLVEPYVESGRARRFEDPELLRFLQMLLEAALDDAQYEKYIDPKIVSTLRQFALMGGAGLAVPVGYALASSGELALWRREISGRLSGYGSQKGWSQVFSRGAKLPSDPIQLVLIAEEAGDLTGMIRESLSYLRDSRARENLMLIESLGRAREKTSLENLPPVTLNRSL